MEDNKGYVYKITSPSGKVYVGVTCNIDTRLHQYRNLNCKNQTRLYNSLVKYSWEAHKFEIIEMIEDDDLNIKLKTSEIRWIAEFDSFKSGLNCTIGGDGNSGRIVSEETKKKISEKSKGRKQSKETIAKRVAKLKGRKRSNEFKEILRKAHTGKILSEETRFTSNS